jgi:membrane protein required for colicin V production
MNGADYLILGILVVSVLLGLFRGFLRESIALLTWLGGIWLAWHFSYLVEPYLGGLLKTPPQSIWAARTLIFIAVYILGSFVGALLAHFVRGSALSLAIDRVLGLAFGFVKGLVMITVLVMLGLLLHLDGVRWWQQSRFMPYAVEVSRWVRAFAEAGVDHLEDHSDSLKET